jgi:hypothetical protein
MQATAETAAASVPELTAEEWRLVTLLVIRHAIRSGDKSSSVLRGLVCKLLKDRSTTIGLGGEE